MIARYCPVVCVAIQGDGFAIMGRGAIRRPLPIRFWLERIDAATVAAIAVWNVAQNGLLYGAGAFLLLDAMCIRGTWRGAVTDHLCRQLIDRHNGGLPLIGRAS